jgi:hypothetical protein
MLTVLSVVPGLGVITYGARFLLTAFAGITAATGYDPLTGQQVEGPGRILAAVAFVAPIAGVAITKFATAWREAGVAVRAEQDAALAARLGGEIRPGVTGTADDALRAIATDEAAAARAGGEAAEAGAGVRLAQTEAHAANADVVSAVGSGRAYSVAYETRLRPTSYPGISRAAHFQEANANLLADLDAYPEFAKSMDELIPGLRSQLVGARSVSRAPPVGWTWHHATEPGVLQLVPRVQHQAPGPIQRLFHAGGDGGYSIWGKT